MAACGSLQQQQHIFENSLPEKPSAAAATTTLVESLSTTWNQITPVIIPVQQQQQQSSSFLDIFVGELHFNPPSDHHQSSSFSPMSSSLSPPPSSSSSPSSSNLLHLNIGGGGSKKTDNGFPSMNYAAGCHHKKSDSFSSMNSESLQLCTEGLGFESFDDVEDMKNETTEEEEEEEEEEGWRNNQQEKVSVFVKNNSHSREKNPVGGELFRRSRSTGGGEFPPPISCIGKSGKPWVCFKSYRHDGRFVLKEIRMRSQEFLHACREDGRLKLQFLQPNDDIQELEEEEEEEESDEEDEVEVDEEEEEEENGSIHDDGEEEKWEADDSTAKYEAKNDLQCRGLQV